MWKGMQRQSRESLFARFAALVAAKCAVIKAPWCFLNLFMSAQIAFQPDTSLTATSKHPLSLININSFIYELQMQPVYHILAYFTMTLLIICSISKMHTYM